jgi:hypothetical protein
VAKIRGNAQKRLTADGDDLADGADVMMGYDGLGVEALSSSAPSLHQLHQRF